MKSQHDIHRLHRLHVAVALIAMLWFALTTAIPSAFADNPAEPDFNTDVTPLLAKYCIGCHNAEDREGGLSLESFDDLSKGIETGPVVLPGQPDSSRLIRLLTGVAEPSMPPEDSEAPSADEIDQLRAWIEAGARGPKGAEQPHRLITPKIVSQLRPENAPITALALSPDGRQLAIARYERVELVESVLQEPVRVIDDLPGKVNAMSFSPDGNQLIVASGTAGLFGQAIVFEVATGELVRTITGHRDILYDAVLSPNGQTLATASYDRSVGLWDAATGDQLRTITGHNGAVFDVAFSPDSTVLASASADETVKLWNVATGERLDTLGQPEAEQYVVAFSPDGHHIVAGGADSRIRVWRFVSRKRPQINPLLFARFAHEGAIVGLAFSPDGRVLISTAEDRSLTLSETTGYTRTVSFERQPDVVSGLAIAPSGNKLVLGRMDGTWQVYSLADGKSRAADFQGRQVLENSTPRSRKEAVVIGAKPNPVENDTETAVHELAEKEPNNHPAEAISIDLPAHIEGTIDASSDAKRQDVDLFRFTAVAGEEWILEINAARDKSPLDSKVEVLTPEGQPIERVILEAVRDSYFSFRGKDSKQKGDYRLHNWEEMTLNEYLYASGEVVKLFLYPRGPDSGFIVYPGQGDRYTYFGTTAVAHALGEPCYVVRPHPPGTELPQSGLPVVPVYFENDDDGMRKWGTDSRLSFSPPADGQYLIRVTDVRGFGGKDHRYRLIVRRPRPDFRVEFKLENETIPAGGGREFQVTADRIDGFDGPIEVHIDDLPPGFFASSPVVIQSGHIAAFGAVNAAADAAPTADTGQFHVSATASIRGEETRHDVDDPVALKLGGKPKVLVTILPSQSNPSLEAERRLGQPLELTISPGETISAVVHVERADGFDDRIPFGNEDAGRNLPHGVYVDNIGLNGLMITQGKTAQEFFMTADHWVPETTRVFHLRARVEGNLTSLPVVLHVRSGRER